VLLKLVPWLKYTGRGRLRLKSVLLSHLPHVGGRVFELEIPISVVVVAEFLGKDDKLSRNLVSASDEWLARYIHPMMGCGA
jgi:hypothetical protein